MRFWGQNEPSKTNLAGNIVQVLFKNWLLLG